MPQKEVQGLMHHDQHNQYKEEGEHLSTSLLPPQTS
jgi:hypothetical protein